MDEKKNDSSLMIIIIVGVVLIAAIIGFLIYNQAKNNKDDVKEPDTTQNENLNTDDLDKDDVAGAYRGTYTATDVTNDKDSADVTDTDDTTGTDTTGNNTTGNNTTTGTTKTTSMELVLDKDGTAKFAKGDNIISGTYTITARTITLVGTEDTDSDTTTNREDKTYKFTVNSDDTLSYTDDSAKKVTLTKTDKDKLDHIK